MLGDTETEVAGLGEVALAQLILLDLEATLEDLLGLGRQLGRGDIRRFPMERDYWEKRNSTRFTLSPCVDEPLYLSI